jgi:hypothetical protein
MRNGTRGAEMEAHAGTINIGTRTTTTPRPGWVAQLRERIRRRRLERAERAYSLRMNGAGARSISGSEHTHLLGRRGF